MRMRRRGLVRTMATTAVVAGTATAVHGAMTKGQNEKAMQQQAEYNAQAVANQQAAAPPPAAAAAQPDYMAELEKLGQLKTQGLITDEEFAAKKKQLLGI